MSAKQQSSEAGAIQVQATLESPILHLVEVEVAAARVADAFERAYRELAGGVRVRGFRPGKAPRKVLERLYGASVAEQLEQTLVSETLGEAIEQAGLEPVTEPSVEASPPVAGAAFRYRARVEVKPAIELPSLAGLPGRRPLVLVPEDDVDAELEALRQRSAPVVELPEGTPLAEGLLASIDFVGRVDGQPFEGGSGQGVEIEIGAGRFVPGFEEQLVGAVAGGDREVRVTFPEDYGHAELAGKQAVFAVHVASVKRREVPALDDEFAKDLGDFETLAALRERIRGDLDTARRREADAVLHRTLLDALIERTPFEVPPGLVERRLEQRLHAAHERFHGQVDHDALHEQLDRWREEWRPGAERQVRETLLLEAIAKRHSLAVSEEEVEARIQQMAAQQGTDAPRLRKAYGGEAFERALASQLGDEKALELLVAQAKVEETTDT